LITLMSSFSARIYGKRREENRRKNKKWNAEYLVH
jgi:predicted site-specific integrase-resolvase